ncbi:MAG: accessory gene regulator B family protein [Eubacteriales bacterium]
MLEKLSARLTEALLRRGAAEESKRELFEYGFQITLSTLLWLATITVIGLVFFDWRFLLCYLLFYLPIRQFAGGYHCSTYGGCYALSNLMFLAVCLGGRALQDPGWKLPVLALGALALLFIFWQAPVMNPSNPLSKRGIRKNRNSARLFVLLDGAGLLLLSLLGTGLIPLSVSALTVFSVACLMIAEKLAERPANESQVGISRF